MSEKAWILKHYVDEFKEPTDEAYILSVFTGTRICERDNSILSPEIQVIVCIERASDFNVLALEFHWHDIKQNLISDDRVSLKIKDSKQKTTQHLMYVGEDGCSVWIPIDEKLKNILLQPDITCLVTDEPEDDFYVTTQYLFKMTSDNLKSLLEQI